MAEGPSAEILSLKRCAPLRDLRDELLAKIALLSKVVTLATGDILTVPEDPEAPFYMVLEGRVQLEQENVPEGQPPYVFKQGEFFGAHAVLYGRSHGHTVVALEPTRLIRLEDKLIDALLQQEPALRNSLREATVMYRHLHGKHFGWVDPDEMVVALLHEYPLYLIVGWGKAVGIALLALAVMYFGIWTNSVALTMIFETIGLAILLAAVVYAVWAYIDWDNDHYVVTDRRIAWVQRIIWLYDSRDEILLSEVRSVEPETSFVGRILGYADLYIKDNFQRTIKFKHITHHLEVKRAIEAQSVEAKKRQTQLDRSMVDNTMRAWIAPPAVPAARKPTASAAREKKPLLRRAEDYFDFRMRLVVENTIVYRRHLIFLFYMQAPAIFSALGVLVLMIILILARLNETITFPSVLTTLLLGGLILAVCFLLWLYQYEDWRNDTYEIRPDKIVVRKKKPLDVDRRTDLALLVEDREEVIGLQYRRAPFLGVIFNYGEVILTVKIPAETQTRKMQQIYNPGQVHQDIFEIVYEKRRKKAQDELSGSGQLKDWFAAYHRQAEELRRQQNQSLNPPDSSVK